MKTPDERKEFLRRLQLAASEADDMLGSCDASDILDSLEESRDYMFESANLIEQLEAQVPKWISVEERLPGSNCDWVLAIGKFVPENTYGKPIISELRKDGKWWGDINDEFPLEDMGIRITHWMPLPEPPKEDDA